MEASEKPQLPLQPEGQPTASATGDGTVRVIGDRIAIESLTIADEQAARVVRDRVGQGHDPASTVRKSIEIGARILESESAAANVDFVNAQFERHMGGLADGLTRQLEARSEELAEQIAESFGADRTGSVQEQIRELIGKANDHQRSEIVRMFNAEDGANPLGDFKTTVTAKVAEAAQRSERQAEALREQHSTESKEMQAQIAALKTEVACLTERREGDSALAEAEAAGTRKGFSFEARVHDAIDAIAATRGDAAGHTGGEGAEGGGKKGDTLVELGAASGPACGRIVFEAKDKNLSKNAAWAELNDAMAARAASFAVLVVAGEERVPSGREVLTEYEGNKLIVAVDPDDPSCMALELAYRLAAARVTMARDRDLTVDAPAVRDAAEEALTLLKQAQAIRAALTGIKTSSDSARTNLDGMVTALKAKLERIDSLVGEAADDAMNEDAPGD